MDWSCSQIKRIVVITFFVCLMGWIYLPHSVSGEKLHLGMKAPPFTLSNLAGTSQTLNNLSKEKELTVIVFWSTWNQQSRDELKTLQELFLNYKSKAFQVIAINVEDQVVSKEKIQSITNYCKELGITFPVLIDQGLQQFNHYAIKAVPTTYLINHEKIIIYKLAGYPISRRTQIVSTIRDILEPSSDKDTSVKEHLTAAEEKAQRYYQMGRVLRKQEDLSSAIDSFHKSIELDDNFFPAYNLLAITLYEIGKREEAIETFNNVASTNSHDLLFQLDYGNFLIQIGEDEKGVAIIKQVLKEDNNYALGHYYLGNYLFGQKKYDEALKEAKTAVKLNPFAYDSYRLLGNIYALQGKKDQSLEAYKKAATLLENKVKGNDLILLLSY